MVLLSWLSEHLRRAQTLPSSGYSVVVTVLSVTANHLVLRILWRAVVRGILSCAKPRLDRIICILSKPVGNRHVHPVVNILFGLLRNVTPLGLLRLALLLKSSCHTHYLSLVLF